MFDSPALAQILSSTIALMGAFVAGLSVYLTYKGRHNQFRQVVYGRQMDAYVDITEAMSNLYTAAENILAAGSAWLKGEDARARFRTVLREEHERFTATVNRSLIVLPSKVKKAVDHFNETLLAISETADAGANGHADPVQHLAVAYSGAINSIRHHLAIDSLTTGMLKEMGIGSESVPLKTHCSGINPLVPVGRNAPSETRCCAAPGRSIVTAITHFTAASRFTAAAVGGAGERVRDERIAQLRAQWVPGEDILRGGAR